MLPAAPAYAAANVICVGSPVGTCNQTVATIPLAITAANTDGQESLILVGPGTYSDGPYVLTGATTTLEGSGGGSTILTMPDSASFQTYVNVNGATVRDLTIQMTGGANSVNDAGLIVVNSGTVDGVTVDGMSTQSAMGVGITEGTLTNSSVLLALTGGTRAVYGQGGNTITDSTLTAAQGYVLSGNAVDTLSRVTIRTGSTGISLDSGTVNVDDSVIDLGSHVGVALQAANFNNSVSPRTVNADHLTIVGGTGGSRGVWAYAATPGALQNTTVNLSNSIVRGPSESLRVDAGNNGAQGGPSNATLNVSYSDFQTTAGTIGANGAGGVLQGTGNVIDVDPDFVDPGAGDYRLSPGSPVVDEGDPAPGVPALDRAGNARVLDGDAVPGAVRDMGAYELTDAIAPDTTIDSGPSGPTGDATPTFTFSSEAGATFECQVDLGAFDTCSSPFTTPSLGDGPHTFAVRATDLATNVDPSPATRAFSVDTAAPDTTITSGPSGLISDATPTFAFSSEVGATFECKVDGGPFAACSSPFTTPSLGNGAHTFAVRGVDAATNADASPATRAFSVDAVAPDTTFTRTPGKKVFTRKVRFKFTSNESGVTFQCKLDAKAYKACTSPYRFKVKLGKHVLRVRAVDAAGNVDATPARYRFKRLPKP